MYGRSKKGVRKIGLTNYTIVALYISVTKTNEYATDIYGYFIVDW